MENAFVWLMRFSTTVAYKYLGRQLPAYSPLVKPRPALMGLRRGQQHQQQVGAFNREEAKEAKEVEVRRLDFVADYLATLTVKSTIFPFVGVFLEAAWTTGALSS
ncbi:hypothetical protein ACLKA7_007149 [Drosophila subpalustris]